MSTKFRYTPGDIIQDQCKPFIKVLTTEAKRHRCDNCFVSNAHLGCCQGCHRMYYCDQECQKEDWKNGHRFECTSIAFKTYRGANLQLMFQLFRTWATLKKPGIGDKPCVLYDGSTKTFNTLMSHQSKHMENASLVQDCAYIVIKLSQEDPSVTLGLFMKYFGIMQTNAFTIRNENESERIGLGLYMEPSIFNHSCKPTAAFHWMNGVEMQIRAVGPILEGEEPCISYMGSLMSREERREELLRRYNFVCNCPKCKTWSDSGVDYKNVYFLLTTLIDPVTVGRLKWRQLVKLHSELVPILESIYYRYDDRVTNQFKRMADYAMTGGRDKEIPEAELASLIRDTEERLLITYGPEHAHYKEFNVNLGRLNCSAIPYPPVLA